MSHEYHIPRNISKKFEFFPGWGIKELIITALGAGIGWLLSFIVYFITPKAIFIRYLIIFFIALISYVSTLPIMPDGSNTLDMLKNIKYYRSRPRLYLR